MYIESRPTQQFEVRNSILNLFEKITIWATVMPLERMHELSRQSGYSGFEWHPLKPTSVAGFQVRMNILNDTEKDSIRSLHESFRFEYGLREIIKRKQLVFGTAASMLLEPGKTSLHALIQLQKQIGKNLPCVVYPRFDHPYAISNLPFSETLVQPKPGDMYRYGLHTAGSLLAKFRSLGVEVCLCTQHLRETDRLDGKKGYEPWQRYFPLFLEHAKEIHIGAGRMDRIYKGVDPLQELRDLYNGSGDSPIMQMLRMIKESGKKLPIVTEIPSSSLMALLEEQSLLLSPKQFIEIHKRIVNTILTTVT